MRPLVHLLAGALLFSTALPAAAQARFTVEGPLEEGAEGGAVPARTGEGHFWFIYRFCVEEPTTLVQHVEAEIELVCVDDGRTVAVNNTEYWEYWAFTEECCSFDQHATEVEQSIALMERAAGAVEDAEVNLECECYRMEYTVTSSLFVGTATPADGGNVQPLEEDCGTFGLPAAPEGETPTSTWTFPGAGPEGSDTEAPNAFEGTPIHRVTFDESTRQSVTHEAVFFHGECPDGSTAEHPEVEGYE